MLLGVYLVFGALSILAQQGRSPRFDNFDIPNGVRVATPPMPVITQTTSSKKVRLMAHTATTPIDRQRVSGNVDPQPRGVNMTVSKSLDGFTTGNALVDSLIAESGARHGVDPVLLYSIMHRESAFKAQAISNKGARGLMQLMPGTAARFGVNNIFDPRQNIEGGARYMRFLLNFFGGDVSLALAGYNAGEGAVLKYGRRIPPYSETQEYVRRITQRYALMRDPLAARKAQRATPAQVASIKAGTTNTTPPQIYERNVFSVRLPNGQLVLISQ